MKLRERRDGQLMRMKIVLTVGMKKRKLGRGDGMKISERWLKTIMCVFFPLMFISCICVPSLPFFYLLNTSRYGTLTVISF